MGFVAVALAGWYMGISPADAADKITIGYVFPSV